MKKVKFLLGILAVVAGCFLVYLVLKNENTVVVHPQGYIAEQELKLIITIIILMLVIVIPTFIWLLATAYACSSKKCTNAYEPDRESKQLLLWLAPSVIVAIMAVITWYQTHALAPSVPIKGKVKPISIEVVAINWKWLFIYPEQKIASLNFFQFPANTPVSLKLTADNAPMCGFWLAPLSGQIYAMSGMVTPLQLIANQSGQYTGRAAEINGDGYSDMTFTAKSTSKKEFDAWVKFVQESPLELNEETYKEVLKSSKGDPITFYSHVEKDLFNNIVMKYMQPS